jgi:hypothetical protein
MERVTMNFVRPDVIACPGSRDQSQAFVARVVVQERIFVGLASGGPATNPLMTFERVARFVWEACYGSRPFNQIHWFDLLWNPDTPANGHEDALLVVIPTVLRGYALRRSWRSRWHDVRVDDAPMLGDRYVVEAGREWAPAVPLTTLPASFQAAVRRSVIQPVRNDIDQWAEPAVGLTSSTRIQAPASIQLRSAMTPTTPSSATSA